MPQKYSLRRRFCDDVGHILQREISRTPVVADDSGQAHPMNLNKKREFLPKIGNKSVCRTLNRSQIVTRILPESAGKPSL